VRPVTASSHRKRVTINDVAAAAGVSRQTVTRAMNDMDEINEVTKQRVLEVSEQLGYRPSRQARSLVERRKTVALGLVVASFRNPYYTEIAGDFVHRATARGYQVLMASTEAADDAASDVPRTARMGEGTREGAALELLRRQVDVLVGHFVMPDAALAAAARGMPLVLLERDGSAPGLHSVEFDIEAGLVDAVAGLRHRGVTRLGMIDSSYSTRGDGRYVPTPRRAFLETMVSDDERGAFVVGEESIAGGAQAFAELVRTSPETDGVVVFNDLMAIGAIQASHALGIRVPGDVRIMGIDGLTLGEGVSPKLSTLSLDRHALVDAALDVVQTLSENDFRVIDPLRRIVRPRILWRESA
jgi:LacI family transcriptional regulator